MNADIRIYPDKELKAVDMAVMLDALSVIDGVIQGCDVSLTSGHLHIEDGRILIKGRLGVVTAGDIETPTLAASATCRLLAVCDLAIDSPFYLSLFPATEYDALVERCESISDFNALNGVAFIELGQAEVDASTGTVTLWTPNTKVSAFRATNPYFEKMGGNYLPAGTNIDTLTKDYIGWWLYDRNDITGTFPLSDTYGIFGHMQGVSDNDAMQFVRSNDRETTNRQLFIRYKHLGAWGAWQRIISTGTTVLTIDRVNNPYCNATTISQLFAVKKGGYLWVRGDLYVGADIPQNTLDVKIAKINGWSSPAGVHLNIPDRLGKSIIKVIITYDGYITLSNYKAPIQPSGYNTGYYTIVAMTPCNDGSE